MKPILRRTVLLALAGLAVLTPLAGCLFSPRTPEPPNTQSVPYLPKTSPSNVWANLQTSLTNTHAFGWEDNIVPEGNDFIYIPDTNADEQFPGVFATWDRAKEINFINNLYDSGVTITAKMRNDDFIVPDPSGNEVVWEGVVYDLTVTSTADNSAIRYRGRAIITFRLVANFWYIAKWEDQFGESNPDNPGQSLPTMGVLRGTFGSK